MPLITIWEAELDSGVNAVQLVVGPGPPRLADPGMQKRNDHYGWGPYRMEPGWDDPLIEGSDS